MKKKTTIVTAILLSLSLLPSANGEDKKNDKNSGLNPIKIELADEAAVIIGGVRITLSEAIRVAIEKNHTILSGKYDVAMTDTLLKQYNTKYSTFLMAEGGYKSVDYPELLQEENGVNVTTYEISGSLTKSFSTGTTVTLGMKNYFNNSDILYTSEYIDNSTAGGPTIGTSTMTLEDKKSYVPVVFVNVQQELLKNFLGCNERKEEEIIKNAVQMQKDAILYVLSLVVVDVIVDYWNVIVYKTHLDNAQLMLQETKKVRRIISDNVKLGLAEQFELNLWNCLVASAEASVAMAEQNYKDALRNFMQTVDMDGEISFEGKAIFSDRLPEINLEEAIKTAYTRRVDYINAKKALENAQLSLDIYENQALPSLVGSLTISSTDVQKDMGESYGNTASLEYPSYEARLTLVYPLDDQNQEVNERNARWKIEQAKQDIKKYERIVRDDVTSKAEMIQTSYKLYLKAKEAREQAEIYYNKMLANLRRGRFTASVVREALDALINSREGELRALVAFNASLLMFEVSKNQLFESYKIDVEKYIPKE